MRGVDPFGNQIAVRNQSISASCRQGESELGWNVLILHSGSVGPPAAPHIEHFRYVLYGFFSICRVPSLQLPGLGPSYLRIHTFDKCYHHRHRHHGHPLLLILNQVCGSKRRTRRGGERRREEGGYEHETSGSNTGNGSILDQAIILFHFCYFSVSQKSI